MQVAKAGGISVQVANRCINEWLSGAQGMAKLLKELPIRRITLNYWMKSTASRIELLN